MVLAGTRTARPTAAGGEVRTPVKTAWASSISAAVLAAFAIAAAIWNHLTPDVYADGMTDLIAAGFVLAAAYTVAAVRVGYTRLLSDRVEHRELFRERVLRRAQVAGYRPQLATKQIRLVAVPGEAKDLVVPLHVVENPVWAAWLETLKDLDIEEHNAVIDVMAADTRLGRNPEQRLQALGSLHRLARRLTWGGLALAAWIFVYPRPYELAILTGVLTPLTALATANLWPGLVVLVGGDDNDPHVNLTMFWLAPSAALALRALFDVHTVDWLPPIGAGAALAAAPFALAWRVEKAAGHPWRAITSAFVALAWGWGAISLANALFDRAPAVVHTAIVVERTGSADKDPGLTLSVADAAPSLPVLKELDVSPARYLAVRVGDRACVAVHPGWLGWRRVQVVDCPSAR